MSLPIYLRHDHWISIESMNMIKTFLLICKRYQTKHNIVIIKYMRNEIMKHLLEMTNESMISTLRYREQDIFYDVASYVINTIEHQYITTKTCTLAH